jgi:hypothetical protein
MDIIKEKIAAIDKVHHEFTAIMAREKCSTCACFHADVLAGVHQAITDLRMQSDDPRLLAAEKDFAGWLEAAAHKTLHQ